jgi:hypothetical protein
LKKIFTHTILLLTILGPTLIVGQTSTIKGIILNDQNQPVQGANVTTDTNGTVTNLNGFYSLKIPAKKNVNIKISHINYKLIEASFNLKNGEALEFNPVLKNSYEQIETVVVKGSNLKNLK